MCRISFHSVWQRRQNCNFQIDWWRRRWKNQLKFIANPLYLEFMPLNTYEQINGCCHLMSFYSSSLFVFRIEFVFISFFSVCCCYCCKSTCLSVCTVHAYHWKCFRCACSFGVVCWCFRYLSQLLKHSISYAFELCLAAVVVFAVNVTVIVILIGHYITKWY